MYISAQSIYKAATPVSTRHLVPWTNSKIEGLTLANSGTNFLAPKGAQEVHLSSICPSVRIKL